MMGKIAIYTCVVGAYDKLLQPAVVDPEFDYICFVGPGEPAGEDGVWKRIPLPKSFGSPRATSRYPKMRPDQFLADYEYSLWIDGNIQILDSTLYEAAKLKVAEGVVYAGVSHPDRDCMYDEAVKCRDMRYFGRRKLCGIHFFYLTHGVKRHAGLFENNLILRKNNVLGVKALGEKWWRMLPVLGGRDQLSLMYCLKECGVTADYLLPKGVNSRNCPGLGYLMHSSK